MAKKINPYDLSTHQPRGTCWCGPYFICPVCREKWKRKRCRLYQVAGGSVR